MYENQAASFRKVILKLDVIKDAINTEAHSMERGKATRHLQISITKIEEAIHRINDAISSSAE